MFDADYKDSGISQGVWDNTDPYTRLPNNDPGAPSTKRHKLDSPECIQMHRKLLALYEDELDRQAQNRIDMAIDEDFYDNIQWREEDARELKERGQIAFSGVTHTKLFCLFNKLVLPYQRIICLCLLPATFQGNLSLRR